jgi:hypothetical protein
LARAVESRGRLSDIEFGFDDRVHFVTELSLELVRDHAVDYALIFESRFKPARTGVAVAFIREALGVDDKTVFID